MIVAGFSYRVGAQTTPGISGVSPGTITIGDKTIAYLTFIPD